MAKPVNPVQTFRATLEKGVTYLGWTVARIPFEPSAVWRETIRHRVRGEVNGVAFRTSLFPDARGGFHLLVNNQLQQQAGLHLGSTAEFQLQPDLDPREAELPDELAVLLDEEEGLRAWYDALSESSRREIGKWIMAVKSDAARMSRSEQMAERLLSTMDAERELPPLIARAFDQRPKAKAGWSRMTETQRRNELMAVFYYRTLESRQKRLEKMLDTAEKKPSA